MKKLTTLIAIICLAFNTTACSQPYTHSSGNVFGSKTIKASKTYVTKEINVSKFEKISMAGGIEVIYNQKPSSPGVEIYTSDNIVDLLDIRVKDHTLLIGFKKNIKVSYNILKIRVNSPDLNGVSVAGSGDFIFANTLKTENDLSISIAGSGDVEGKEIHCKAMKVSIAGAGDMEMQSVVCNSLKASVAGSGDIHLKNITTTDVEASIAGSGEMSLHGTTQNASYSISGSGDLTADGLKAQKVNTSIAGSGDIKCFATEYLKVRTSGSGSVGYKGNPEIDTPKKGLYKL